jgi:hypothetical protein
MSTVLIGLAETWLGELISEPVTTTALRAVGAVDADAGASCSAASAGIVVSAAIARAAKTAWVHGRMRSRENAWALPWALDSDWLRIS